MNTRATKVGAGETAGDRDLQIEEALRELLATIELHTDCMDGRIDRAALDPWIEKAEEALGETIEEIIA